MFGRLVLWIISLFLKKRKPTLPSGNPTFPPETPTVSSNDVTQKIEVPDLTADAIQSDSHKTPVERPTPSPKIEAVAKGIKMGGGFIINGKLEQVPGLNVVNWRDDPKLRLRISDVVGSDRDGMPRSHGTSVRAIVFHTTKGVPGGADHRPQVILPGFGKPINAGDRTAVYWSTDPKHKAGAHLVVDFDGLISQCCDLQTEAAFHCPGWNSCGIGIEIYQGNNAELYDSQLGITCVALADFLTRRFAIQRQIPKAYKNHPLDRLVHGSDDYYGVAGHRDCDANRGCGDPGDALFDKLKTAGYEGWDLDAREDVAVWQARQKSVGLVGGDGIPGPKTLDAFIKAGKIAGMWVPRPGDVPNAPLVA